MNAENAAPRDTETRAAHRRATNVRRIKEHEGAGWRLFDAREVLGAPLVLVSAARAWLRWAVWR
ncbi:hypothetical protein [Nocardia sp. NPDC127526]|uniref:hypothetical protein n=1 Tax=Nocardia sp. NPDC127526 TaxID=3345393 RepID=UPI0036294A60